jgi:hypothetical protein
MLDKDSWRRIWSGKRCGKSCENVWTVKFNCMELYGMFEQLACIKLKVHSNSPEIPTMTKPIFDNPFITRSFLGQMRPFQSSKSDTSTGSSA